jgi:hypothetical protein
MRSASQRKVAPVTPMLAVFLSKSVEPHAALKGGGKKVLLDSPAQTGDN